MKCGGIKQDGSPCDYTSEGKFHFCPVCGGSSGSRELAKSPDKELSCPGNGDGPCGNPIKETCNFCSECGWKVDKTLFRKVTMKCPNCHTECLDVSKFCSQCGKNLMPLETARETSHLTVDKHGAGDAAPDANANVKKSQRGYEVHFPPLAIQETEKVQTILNQPVHNEQYQTSISEPTSSNVILQGKERTVPRLPGNENVIKPNSSTDIRSTPKESMENNTTPRTSAGEGLQKNPSEVPPSNVAYVTVMSAQTAPGIKRSSSLELENDAKKTRTSPEPSGESNSITGVHENPNCATVNVNSESQNVTVKATTVHVNLNQPTIAGTTVQKDGSNQESKESQKSQNTKGNEKDKKKPEPSSNVSDTDRSADRKSDKTSSKTAKSVQETSTKNKKTGVDETKREDPGKERQSKTNTTSSQTKNASYSNIVSGSKQKSGGGSNKQGAKGKATTRQSTENEVEVVFHALISEEMNLDRSNDKVFIRFGPDILGGFQRSTWGMTFVRQIQEGAYEYSCKVAMPKDLRIKGFKYKYIVHRPDKVSWEEPYYRQKNYSKGSIINRFFDLPSARKQLQGTWHQYDGFVYPKMEKDKGLWERFTGLWKSNYGEKIRHDTEIAAKTFMPLTEEIITCISRDVPFESHTAEDILEHVFMVYSGLNLQMLDKNLEKVDDGLREKFFFNFFKPLQDYLLTLVEKRTPNSTETCGIVLASFLLLVAWENDMSHLLQKDTTLLKAFLPHPDYEKKICPDIDAVKSHFANKATKELVICLRRSINAHGQGYSYYQVPCDTQWLYLVPLLHFLRKDSVPFQKEYNKETTKSKWWGHEEIDSPKDTMKRNYQWSMYVCFIYMSRTWPTQLI